MKKIIIHSIPIMISIIWLFASYQTLNPVILKGPDFLKFYIILVLGFFASVFIINSLEKNRSKTTLYLAGLIFLLGIIKLIRGITLGKPIGFLVMILIGEGIVTIFFILPRTNKKIK